MTNITITANVICADENDAFRRAFAAIARAAVRHMDDDCPYISDMLYDAARAASLPTHGRFYLLVRDYGTNAFCDPLDAIAHCGNRSDGKAVLRVERNQFDTFKVDVIYTRSAGLIMSSITRDV